MTVTTEYTMEDAQCLARHCGLSVGLNRDSYGGRYRVARLNQTMYLADDLEDVMGWLTAWAKYAA